MCFCTQKAVTGRLTSAHLESFERFCDLAAERAKSRGMNEEVLNSLLNDSTEELL